MDSSVGTGVSGSGGASITEVGSGLGSDTRGKSAGSGSVWSLGEGSPELMSVSVYKFLGLVRDELTEARRVAKMAKVSFGYCI